MMKDFDSAQADIVQRRVDNNIGFKIQLRKL